MLKRSWKQNHPNTFDILNGKGVSTSEVRSIYRALQDQHVANAQGIAEAIEQNDYVTLKILLEQRKGITGAIEATIQDSSKVQVFKDHIIDMLSSSATFADEKGQIILDRVTDIVEKANSKTHNLVTSTVDTSARMISKGNRLNHKTGKFILDKASDGLSMLSSLIKNKF
ncbi:hypothetical protein QR721_13560 [Aciduricibacillus chroicocephali]|uniref:Uncharacterized protein n=1 Tax=Aciduricibacillus chroicocephali TaxID=3054939 RepID=A0ABY9KYH1_9BACI|nr:hypothetical protein QR721_13560 [Bacillaceae bacterium 44XB]